MFLIINGSTVVQARIEDLPGMMVLYHAYVTAKRPASG
jgi:hypothetical protein